VARTRFKVQSDDGEARFILCSWSRIPTTHLTSKHPESEVGLPELRFEDSGGTANPKPGDDGAFEDPERPGKIYRVIDD
jgi:hypothetical protein